MLQIKNKHGALELSIGTIVIIVIGMSMLILGLVLVKTIFTGSTAAIGQLNSKVQGQISSLFVDGGNDIVIMTSDRSNRVKIKPGDLSDVGIGMLTENGDMVSGLSALQYRLSLDSDTTDNCWHILGGNGARAKDLFTTRVDSFNGVDKFDGSTAFALVEINVPKGTAKCTQKVHVEIKEQGGEIYAADFFVLEILSEGFF
jgi:hypothetical protein|tara:strand:+ start:344 stop:946 length:603 start_codon:yes stop_codon:yes gene_type:complete